MRVWLADWEWQCCGEPFAVGDDVEWILVEADDAARASFGKTLGPEIGQSITHWETHHQDDDEERLAATRACVESITAVYWRYAPRTGADERVLHPVAGTGVFEPRTGADGWEPESDAGPSFAGYIVDLSPPS